MTSGELRAAEYRARAQEALASVDSASLERVREQRRRSAAAWNQMAEALEMRAQSRRLPRSPWATLS
jgi:hypothetical protein